MSIKTLGKQSLVYGIGHILARLVTFLLLPLYTNVFTTSEYIKNRYSKPVGFGKNLKDIIMWQSNMQTGITKDPYKLLPNKYQDLDMPKEKLFLENGKIQDGASAMMAFGKMQFTDMDNQERDSLVNSLLQYCELDTLAMLMIYEHWKSIK